MKARGYFFRHGYVFFGFVSKSQMYSREMQNTKNKVHTFLEKWLDKSIKQYVGAMDEKNNGHLHELIIGGIDKVYEFLVNKEDVGSFFIELGGEVRSTSRKSNSQPWKVGIINPLEPSKIIHTFFSSDYLSFAMATSGDYRNIRIFDDMEMSHTIDPVSGVPSEYSKKSVSVISKKSFSFSFKFLSISSSLKSPQQDQTLI